MLSFDQGKHQSVTGGLGCPSLLHISLLLSLLCCLYTAFHCIVQCSEASNIVLFCGGVVGWFLLFCCLFGLFSSGDCLKDNPIWSRSPTQACLLSFPLSAKTVNCQVQGSAFSHIILTLCITLSWVLCPYNCFVLLLPVFHTKDPR